MKAQKLLNKLSVLALAGLILAVTTIGSASATDQMFSGYYQSKDEGGVMTKEGNAYGSVGAIYPYDTVGWNNGILNRNSAWENGAIAYSCSELYIPSSQLLGTIQPNSYWSPSLHGSLGGNANLNGVSYGIYSLTQMVYGNGRSPTSAPANDVISFTEYKGY